MCVFGRGFCKSRWSIALHVACGAAVDGLGKEEGRKEGRKRVLFIASTSFLEEALESGLAEKEGSSAKGGGAGAAAAASIHNGGIMAGCDVNHLVRYYCLRASPWCHGQAQPGKLLLLLLSFSPFSPSLLLSHFPCSFCVCLSLSLPIFSVSMVRG